MAYIPNKPYDLSFRDGVLEAFADLRKHFPKFLAEFKDKESPVWFFLQWAEKKVTGEEIRNDKVKQWKLSAAKRRVKVLIRRMQYDRRIARAEKVEKEEEKRRTERAAAKALRLEEEIQMLRDKQTQQAAQKKQKKPSEKRPGPYYVQALWKKLDGMEKNQEEILRCLSGKK